MVPITWAITIVPDKTIPQVLRLLSGIALYYAIVNWATTQNKLKLVVYGVVVASLFLVFMSPISVTWVADHKLSFLPSSLYERFTILVSDTVHPNVMGGNLAMFFPIPLGLLVYAWRQLSRIERLLFIIVVLSITGVVILTKSRGAWLALGAILAFISLLRLRSNWRFIAGMLIFVPLVAYFTVSFFGVDYLLPTDALGGIPGRLEIASRAIYMIRDFAFTGIGMGAFQDVADSLYPFLLFPTAQIVHAHNLFLQIGVDLGLPGLISWLSIFLLVIVCSIKIFLLGRIVDNGWYAGLGVGLMGSQLALTVHGLTDAVTWGMVRPAPLVWVFWGLTIAVLNSLVKSPKIPSALPQGIVSNSETGTLLTMHPHRVNILGVGISAINLDHAIARIRIWIEERTSNYVCVTPAHGIMECQRDPELRRIFNSSGFTTPDGMSIVWLLRAKGYRHVNRVYGPDLLLAACEKSVEYNWRHFFYGGEPLVADQLVARLSARFPGLQIAGVFSPPFRPQTPEEDLDIIQRINDTNADIVWVGISTPKQEKWMAEHYQRISAPVLIGIGAAFDFLSGNKPQAPVWIQRSGLEWLFRLGTEPRRLWKRYIQYPYFGLLVLAQELGLTQYTIESKISHVDGLMIDH